MAGDSSWVQVGKRKIELTNLGKLLFPEQGITKAEFIQYYHRIAPTLLYHVKGRPLTLIRYPDGIGQERFYQKNKPDWAPSWIESVSLGQEKKKDYITLSEAASLLWLANLASVELHEMNFRRPGFGKPDYMSFDLDPPEDSPFERVVETAFSLKEHIETYGYHTFVKTSGGKGVHLFVPLVPEQDVDTVFKASKAIAATFVAKYKDETTLRIKKKERNGRILIDIYRNRQGQTVVSPYSLRGRPGAPVSMPISWEELAEVKSSQEYRLDNVPDKLEEEGDAWEGIGGYAAHLHTHRRKSDDPDSSLPYSPRYKSPDQLEEYVRKRDFSKTPEPVEDLRGASGSRFVIHRHHATRLHYDLRLEQDGVLKSWAVPKGMPPRPGVKRLAVQTEDHPVEYLDFEGKIPKEEYGGGDMWIYSRGRYEITKQKKSGFYFRLESTGMSGEYRMHEMKDREWLLEKVEEPQRDWLNEPVPPMHAERREEPPSDGYLYEVKWDGIRALISLEDGGIRIRSRNGNDITSKFPELQTSADAFRAACGLFDGEIVCLDSSGKPSFELVIQRLKASGQVAIRRLSGSSPTHCYLFDCLYLDGRALVNEPFTRRHEWLEDLVKKGMRFRLSETMEDGEALFHAAREHGLEGIVAKKSDGLYLPGKRTDLWVKVKVAHTTECVVIGYTRGKRGQTGTFGALHLAEEMGGGGNPAGGRLVYRGKVGTGFDERKMKKVYEVLKKLKTTSKPPLDNINDDKETTWVEPELIVEITYGRFSGNGIFMESVYVRMRPDLSL